MRMQSWSLQSGQSEQGGRGSEQAHKTQSIWQLTHRPCAPLVLNKRSACMSEAGKARVEGEWAL